MRQVYQAADPVNAEIVKDYLGGHGIEAQVRGDLLWGGRGELPADGGPGVWVASRDFDQARQLIGQLERGRASASTWQCPDCHERLEGQFTHCWHCGRARP